VVRKEKKSRPGEPLYSTDVVLQGPDAPIMLLLFWKIEEEDEE